MKFTVKDKVMTRTGGTRLFHKFRTSYPKYFSDLAQYLPDMEFVVNVYDEPRILKRKCAPDKNWAKCACDKGYEIQPHVIFVKPCNWPVVYDDILPIFSSGTIPECFADFLVPSP